MRVRASEEDKQKSEGERESKGGKNQRVVFGFTRASSEGLKSVQSQRS